MTTLKTTFGIENDEDTFSQFVIGFHDRLKLYYCFDRAMPLLKKIKIVALLVFYEEDRRAKTRNVLMFNSKATGWVPGLELDFIDQLQPVFDLQNHAELVTIPRDRFIKTLVSTALTKFDTLYNSDPSNSVNLKPMISSVVPGPVNVIDHYPSQSCQLLYVYAKVPCLAELQKRMRSTASNNDLTSKIVDVSGIDEEALDEFVERHLVDALSTDVHSINLDVIKKIELKLH